jgi:hypothetical protein
MPLWLVQFVKAHLETGIEESPVTDYVSTFFPAKSEANKRESENLSTVSADVLRVLNVKSSYR